MIEVLTELLHTHRESLYIFLRRLRSSGRSLVSGPDLQRAYEAFLETELGEPLAGTELGHVIACTQEVVLDDCIVHVRIRHRVARWTHVLVHAEEMEAREVSVSEFLDAKERLVTEPGGGGERHVLEIDLGPFEREFPKLTQARSVGRGVEFLNRVLSGRLFEEGTEGTRRLLEFLRVHAVRGRQLMLNGAIEDVAGLRRGLRRGVEIARAGGGDWQVALRRLGFETGWGRTPEAAAEMMQLLLDVMEAPDPQQLAEFLARIPMITSIAILSPHGYFGQSNVLGKPDTGGQVVYILDQVRALEHEMRSTLQAQGLDIEPDIVVLTRLIPEAGDTTCDQRLEPILGTRNARILRVPFRTPGGQVEREWISRFKIWPYLERFALEAERELLAELGGKPDFVIGNYSDGNLVASLLAQRLGVTQCNIAHALEKTKYPNSDLEWKAHEEEHHFACQFTADLIAMNTADFIITSTYQEIAGDGESVGQYESYQAYTLPGLYRVVSGIDCFDPKFNIVSPGANPDVFFPYWDHERRTEELTREIRSAVFGDPSCAHRGTYRDVDKPILFAMSRLDRVKNTAGLVEWFGENEKLRERVNLLLVGGWLDPAQSNDPDEQRQIELTHELMDRYELDAQMRWLEMQTDKNRVGEFYRVVADSRGGFVQPAVFEAFGLTVIEAMSSGLPVFVTRYGGPREIVEDGRSGRHIDPNLGVGAVDPIVAFFERTADDPEAWDTVSRAAVERVQERYNWSLYASRLLELSRIYGFWKYITSLERDETRRYLEMFYALMYRPLANAVPTEDE